MRSVTSDDTAVACARVALHLRDHPEDLLDALQIANATNVTVAAARFALRLLEGEGIVIRIGNPTSGLPSYRYGGHNGRS